MHTSQEETPVNTAEVPAQRTVADFYRGVAANVTPETPQQILQKNEEIQALQQKLQGEKDAMKKNLQAQENTGFFDVRSKIDLSNQAKNLETNINEDYRQKSVVNKELKNLTSVASELNSNIASPETVIRTINPVRLETLAQANEPLPGQEAQVRIADLTPEQVAQRRQQIEQQRAERLAGLNTQMPLPENNMTESQKDEIITEGINEYKDKSAEILASTLTKRLQSENSSIARSNEQIPFEVSEEAVKTFVKVAYEGEDDTLTIEDASLGFFGLSQEAKDLESKYVGNILPQEARNEIDFIKSKAAKAEKLEAKAIFMNTMWQVTNEIATASGDEEISAEDFARSFQTLSENWDDDTSRGSRILEKTHRFRNTSGPSSSSSPATNYFEGITQDILERCGHTSTHQMERKDIPTAMAYYAVALEKGTKPVDISNVATGIEIAMQHMLRNSYKEGDTINGVNTLLSKMRPTSPDNNALKMGNIMRPYRAQFSSSRAFDIQNKVYRGMY